MLKLLLCTLAIAGASGDALKARLYATAGDPSLRASFALNVEPTAEQVISQIRKGGNKESLSQTKWNWQLAPEDINIYTDGVSFKKVKDAYVRLVAIKNQHVLARFHRCRCGCSGACASLFGWAWY